MIADIEGDFKDLINNMTAPDEVPILAVRNRGYKLINLKS